MSSWASYNANMINSFKNKRPLSLTNDSGSDGMQRINVCNLRSCYGQTKHQIQLKSMTLDNEGMCCCLSWNLASLQRPHSTNELCVTVTLMNATVAHEPAWHFRLSWLSLSQATNVTHTTRVTVASHECHRRNHECHTHKPRMSHWQGMNVTVAHTSHKCHINKPWMSY